MAVEDKYVNGGETGNIQNAAFVGGGYMKGASTVVSIAAADDDGSKYRLAKLPSNAVMMKIEVFNSAITNGTSYDIGLYDTLENGGAAVDKDVFMAAQTMASERLGSAPLNGFTGGIFGGTTGTTDEMDYTLGEIGAKTASTVKSEYDLVLTANTIGTVAGTVTVKYWYAIIG